MLHSEFSEPKYRDTFASVAKGLNSFFFDEPDSLFSLFANSYERQRHRGAHDLPTRDEFDLDSIGRALSRCVLYDVSRPGRVEFRIVGEDLRSHFSETPKGRDYLEFVPEERRQYALGSFEACRDFPCAMLCDVIQFYRSGPACLCRTLGVPLRCSANPSKISHLLFVDVPQVEPTVECLDLEGFYLAHLKSRAFIDIGYGAPKNFRDRIVGESC